ncbi:MAG: hypothetical protein QGI49_04440 [SAR202 cluster bacterium]|jgi:hypothetical protein|nr:hypothetical protein [SAR202 cluster bacterium]
MEELTKDEVKTLARAVGIELDEPDLTPVSYQLNAMLEGIANIDLPGLDEIEPLPIIWQRESD